MGPIRNQNLIFSPLTNDLCSEEHLPSFLVFLHNHRWLRVESKECQAKDHNRDLG